MEPEKIRLGIGFATGRKNFKKVLNSYVYSWNESGIRDKLQQQVSLNLFIAYDLDYSNTQSTDFTNLPQEMVDAFDNIIFLGSKNAQNSVLQLIGDGDLSPKDAKLLFSAGYAGKRNAIMYAALEHGMDYILYLDDDEYPVAVTKSRDVCLWGGQYVLPIHLQHIANADITNGHHCGYISPIPQITFNDVLSEDIFSKFIGAISNDIVTWESVKKKMKSGGVTYADTEVLLSEQAVDVEEISGCKFISGSNLCINLRKPERTAPFYNPPGARGEDTFLSTLLSKRTVLRVPCYTFHDGFSAYRHLLDGVLPLHLEPVLPTNQVTVTRFFQACIGWIRYKPLLMFITNPETYDEEIKNMREIFQEVLPHICEYFNREEFMQILSELEKYDRNVKKYYMQFTETQKAWEKLLKNRRYWM
ncbi:MAG: hypothetical protein ACRDA4_07360 [Filifactoraceae bacterium]